MFALLKRGFGGGSAKPSLDAVCFDTTGYAFQGEPEPGKVRVWHTPENDSLGVYFFSVPPDLPANAGSGELAAVYRRLLGDSGGKLVDVAVVMASGCPAVRTIISVPQQPSGRTFVASSLSAWTTTLLIGPALLLKW